jgi:hypothetical protein
LRRLDERFCVVIEGPDTIIFENMGPERWMARKEKDIQKQLENVYIEKIVENDKGGIEKTVLTKMHSWYFNNPDRRSTLHAVFRPNQSRFPAAGEFNIWQGWGVTATYDFRYVGADGKKHLKWQLRTILRHALHVLCSSNQEDYLYFINWHAWKVQNLDKIPHTTPIFTTEVNGAGKSVWGKLIIDIIGRHHAALIINDEHLTSKHAVHPYLCYAVLDDFAGDRDPKVHGRIRALTTSEWVAVEPKNKEHRPIRNMIALTVTTHLINPLAASVAERRQFVPTVNEQVAQEKWYFDLLFRAVDDGGREMLLGYLLTKPLNGWTPHAVRKTARLGRNAD